VRRDHFDAKYETSRFEKMIGVDFDPFQDETNRILRQDFEVKKLSVLTEQRERMLQ